MRVEWLASLVEAISSGSMTAAAAKLSYSPQVISQHIASLESELGYAVVQRSPRGVAPTPQGLAYLDAARDALALLSHAKEQGKQAAGDVFQSGPAHRACPFRENQCCTHLSQRLHSIMCGGCSLQHFERFAPIDPQYLSSFAVCVSGIVAMGDFKHLDKPSQCRTVALAIGGNILAVDICKPHKPANAGETAGGSASSANYMQSDIFLQGANRGSLHDVISSGKMDLVAITDVAVANLDEKTCKTLYETDIEFLHWLVLNEYWSGSIEAQRMLASHANARKSILYAISTLQRAGVSDYTHQQVALISNRTRPVVTKVISELAAEGLTSALDCD